METGNKQKPLSLYLGIAALLLLITFYLRAQYQADRSYERLAYILFGVLYMMRFSLKTERGIKDYAKVVAIAIWCFLSVLAAVKFKYSFILVNICLVSGLIWFITEIIDLIKGKTQQTNWILVIGGLIVAIDIFIRVFGTYGAAVPRIVAPIILSIGFFSEVYLHRKSTQA